MYSEFIRIYLLRDRPFVKLAYKSLKIGHYSYILF